MSELPRSAPEGAPEWMVSYADMITIMMAFFVVLYASTSASGTKDKGGKAGQEPKGGKEATLGMVVDGQPGTESQGRMQKVFESLYYRFGPEWTLTNCWLGGPSALRQGSKTQTAQEAGENSNRSMRLGRGGKDAVMFAPKLDERVIAGGRVFFDDYSIKLDPAQEKQLKGVAEDLAGKLQRIEIRGHASRRPLPPGSPYRDRWDLAYARCRAVNDFLVAQGIDARRIRLGVAGDNEPVQAVGNPLAIRHNSRVDIHLLNEWVSSQ